MHKIKPLGKVKSLICVCGGAMGVFSLKCYLEGNENFYEKLLIPIVHYLEPEQAHNAAVLAAKYRFFPRPKYPDSPVLKTNVWGLTLNNPIGMAAGFDKDGEAVDGLFKLGFGFVEIGSVTPLPQPGNPKPRVFRLPQDEAVINRYGFNSSGHAVVFERIKDAKEKGSEGVVGVNLGKNKLSSHSVKDYVEGIKLFGPVAHYLVINVSSPNTPGLREWQRKEMLETLLKEVVAERDKLPSRPPLLLKLSPDLSYKHCEEIASVILSPQCRVDGLVISNTSTERMSQLKDENKREAGGLSGRPLASLSTSLISHMYSLTEGKIPIIGVGGVFTGEDAYEKIKAGASLVQIYTAFIYHGPPRITRIKKELQELLEADGYKSVSEAIGKDIKLNQVKLAQQLST